MPYIESETKAKLREIRNTTESVLDGITEELVHYEVTKEHFLWLLGQVEKVDKLQVQLDAKLTFISNGKEEELYVLQEENIALKAISSVTVYDNGVVEINYADRQSMLINDVVYSDGFLTGWDEEDCGIKR